MLAFHDGAYHIDYSAPKIVVEGAATFTQTCRVGDLLNNGKPVWVDFGAGLLRVFGHQDKGYGLLWQGTWSATHALHTLGASAIGDADNDGLLELLHVTQTGVQIWKHTDREEPALENVYTFPNSASATAVDVGILK